MLNSNFLKTPVFDAVTKKTLTSPFSKKYDSNQWKAALLEAEDNERDINLCLAAIFFGGEVRNLRASFIEGLFKNISKRCALTLAVGSVNRHFFAIQNEFRKEQREISEKDTQKPFHFMGLGSIGIKTAPQPELSIDDLITSMVDSLPHWFFEAKNLPKYCEILNVDFGELEYAAGSALSVEASLRGLWNSALWEGKMLKSGSTGLAFGPANYDNDSHWYAWQKRTEAALFGPIALNYDLSKERSDLRHILSAKVSRRRGGRFNIKTAKPSKNQLQELTNTIDILERTYLCDFMDERVTVYDVEISMRILVQALWVLETVGIGLRKDISIKHIKTYNDAKQFSLRITKTQCAQIISECLKIDRNEAAAICKQLTLQPDDTEKCFSEGIWLHPLVELDETSLMIVMPSIVSGSKIRFVERSLMQLVGSDFSKTETQGKNFEKNTRRTIYESLSSNTIILDYTCLLHALKRKNEGDEEIDLLFRIGDTIIVGELKCLLAPSEPIERYNYIKKLEYAANQAKRKSSWLNKNPQLIKDHLNTNKHHSAINIVPMVILNQRVGSGLVVNDTIITDMFFLDLFTRYGYYTANAVVTKGKKALFSKTLYKTQAEAEAEILRLFSSPPPLRPFLEGIEWMRVKFPVVSGHVWIELDTRINLPIPVDL